MGWQDRNYNTGSGGGSGSEYLGNPLAILNFSVPFGNWFGARVRLHFFLLLQFIFIYIASVRTGGPLVATITCALFLVALLCHEFGHRFFARLVHGSHNEFMLWPAGGMIPPNAPPFPGSYFLAHAGGMIVNLSLALLSSLAIYFITYNLADIPWNPLAILFGFGALDVNTPAAIAAGLLFIFASINLGIFTANLLPYYWFDGGPLLQAILWPFIKLHNAINVTCIVGMVFAVPMFFLALFSMNLLGMIFWALLFASSYTKRQQLKAVGTQELEEAIAWSANYSNNDPAPRKKLKKRWINAAKKRAAAEQNEQAQIDAILAKVKEKGLHSLTWWEKRALRKATERQRQRDLAERR
jgi:hypothetical protein